jgi:hypothetical protein
MTIFETVRATPSRLPQTSTLSLSAVLAYAAATLFILASAATNFLYGWQKGATVPESVVWSSVSVAASIVFALSWPALSSATSLRRTCLVLMAMLITGCYSIVAALGSASGGRVNAHTTEQATTETKSNLQAAHKVASAELSSLVSSRTVGELSPVIAALKFSTGANGCTKVDGPVSRKVCSEVANLEAEAARSQRRSELEATIRTTTDKLASIQPAKQANSDAAALVGFLAALGLTVDVDSLNRVLVLLAVLVVECGGGLSLAVAGSLTSAEGCTSSRDARLTDNSAMTTANTGTVEPSVVFALPTIPSVHLPETPNIVAPVPPAQSPSMLASTQANQVNAVQNSSTRDKVLAFVTQAGGTVRNSQRTIAKQVGVSPSRLNAVLAELAGDGVLKVRAGATGTVLALA